MTDSLLTLALAAPIDLPALQRLAPSRYPLLMESTASGTAQGRWDLLLLGDGQSLRLDADGVVRDQHDGVHAGTFLEVLDRHWQELRIPRAHEDLPFRGGWALLLDYELAGQIETVLQLPVREDALPSAIALRCPAAVLHDRQTGGCLLVAEAGQGHWLEQIQQDMAALTAALMAAQSAQSAPHAWQPPLSLGEDDPQRFCDGVERVIDYLRAGDVFQVNLSRRWQAQLAPGMDVFALYRQLRVANPAPFAGLFTGLGRHVASSSPERLVAVHGDDVQTRPIAGTRPRTAGDDDAARIRELVDNPKERAEHVMLIDLERNDLGRICRPGSVRVDELMTVESYAHVHHIVSNVSGTLLAGTTPGEVIAATFPGGTITGCPKVRCMQIIAELEQQARGAYTGAFGWLNRDGDMDLNILIRTAEIGHVTHGLAAHGQVANGQAIASFRTGAGIVVDSVADRELDETRAKARGLLRAMGAVE